MFQFWKTFETTGIVKNENYGSPALASGIRTFDTTGYTSGSVRFVVSNRGKLLKPSADGRKEVERLTTYFGWDEINTLSGNGIILTYGKTKLVYDNSEYRLVGLDDYGRGYNVTFMNVGLIKAIFERETTHGSY